MLSVCNETHPLLAAPLELAMAKQFFLAFGAADLSVWSLVSNASGVVIAVMLMLVAMSVMGWYIIAYKYMLFSRALRESYQFADAFWRASRIDALQDVANKLRGSPLSHMFLAGYSELQKLQNR